MKLAHILVVPAVFALSGCNVDRVRRDRTAVDGPQVGQTVPPRKAAKVNADLAVLEQREVDLVEDLLSKRMAYHQSLEQLRTYYRDRGHPTKESWAAFELESAKKVKQFKYILDAEVPSASLRPEKSIPQADAMFEEARSKMRKGGDSIPIFYSESAMLESARMFQEMIQQYPDSDKIDDAAFYLGEIHKDYLKDQEALAVAWYERAWQWDPNTPHPAKFQAALVCDFRLNDRDRALELYRQVLAEDSDLGRINRRYAMHRVEEITRPNRTVQAVLPQAN